MSIYDDSHNNLELYVQNKGHLSRLKYLYKEIDQFYHCDSFNIEKYNNIVNSLDELDTDLFNNYFYQYKYFIACVYKEKYDFIQFLLRNRKEKNYIQQIFYYIDYNKCNIDVITFIIQYLDNPYLITKTKNMLNDTILLFFLRNNNDFIINLVNYVSIYDDVFVNAFNYVRDNKFSKYYNYFHQKIMNEYDISNEFNRKVNTYYIENNLDLKLSRPYKKLKL